MDNAVRAAAYCRLSRDDGDRVESDSIVNQQHTIEDFCKAHPAFEISGIYVDDGCTGTNFDRPGFQKMKADIECGAIECVIVKDLSRFGRDYIDMGYYLERYFPQKGVRFIAINDGVDSGSGAYNMLLPIKNVFNTQYAKDISEKVRSAFRAKQKRGEFCGAFAAYGYLKNPKNNDCLLVDPAAAEIVQRIFAMAAEGIGTQAIADALNQDDIPSPGAYKRLMGMNYRNGQQEKTKQPWTYAAVHRILQNQLYIGNMVANRTPRKKMHGKAQANQEENWVIVPGTHEPIISRELWESVQAQANKNARSVDAVGHGGLFTGFLRCGDCGSPMVKLRWNRRTAYACGSYRRYGKSACTNHYIMEDDITNMVLDDLNQIICRVRNLRELATHDAERSLSAVRRSDERARLEEALRRVRALKRGVYEDYRDKLLSKEEYKQYRDDYAEQEEMLSGQLERLSEKVDAKDLLTQSWANRLAELGKLSELDRATLSQTVKEIRVYEGRIEIVYLFSDELGALLKPEDNN